MPGLLAFLWDIRRGLQALDAEAAERKAETCERWRLTPAEYDAVCTFPLDAEPKQEDDCRALCQLPRHHHESEEPVTDYAAANALWRRHRTALTRATNKARRDNTEAAHGAVLVLVAAQQAEWDAKGWPWPDDWSRWDRATRDAAFKLGLREDRW